ncbi:MAG: MFS transporter [Crocinitomicaceae bacterium]|nr:MFS transporter [Crocinitomicaceae bacterium]
MLALVMLLNRTGAMVIPFLAIYVTKELHFSKVEAGIVLSTFGIGSVIGSLLGGWLTDKIGSFRVQSLSLFLSAPIFALIPQFTTLNGIAGIILLLSIIAETFRPSNSASISLYAKPENITRAFSLNRMAINLGFSLGPAMGGLLATISYSWLFYGNAVGAFVTGIVFYGYFRFRRKNRKSLVVHETIIDADIVDDERSPYKDKLFLVFSLMCVLYSIVFSQLISVLPLFYGDAINLSQAEIGMILGYSGIFIVLTEMVIVHYLETKLDLYANIVIGSILLGVTFFLLIFSQSTPMLYISMTFLCLSEILVLPFISTVAAVRAGKKYKGAYMGVNALSFSIALIITPYLATQILTVYGYDTLWIINTVISILAALGFYYVGRKMKLEQKS